VVLTGRSLKASHPDSSSSQQITAETAISDLEVDHQVDAVAAFNAGVWGYPSWKDGIVAMAGLKVPCLVTAYTSEESEDDEDAIADMCKSESGTPIKFLWGASKNANFNPVKKHDCPVTGRAMYENAAWLCFQGIAAPAGENGVTGTDTDTGSLI